MSDNLNVPNKNFRILVVDDEKDLRQYYTTVLSRIEGAEIFTASTLEEAVQIVKEKNPFLLVQDIELYQNKNGWDIIEEIRTWKMNHFLPNTIYPMHLKSLYRHLHSKNM
jgi:DNA-binding response OmpR family regulator